MPVPLIIVGAGGFGREVFAVVEAINRVGSQRYEVLGFLDDGAPDTERIDRLGSRFLGNTRGELDVGFRYVIGIGMKGGAMRKQIDRRFAAAGLSPCDPLVHPSAWIGPDVTLGLGTVVCAGASITTNVRTGRHVHINPNVNIGHDCRIGDYVTVAPLCAVSGAVTLEDEVDLGASATILPGVRIGQGALVGAGAVVTRDVDPRSTVVGLPARPCGRG
jgi:sugar O-acyltransferase (sialic acid O-acetyltransferase NeuD family)